MEGIDKARWCAKYAEDKKAENLVIMDLRGISPITDYFVICTASSAPHLRAVRDAIEDGMREDHDLRPLVSDGNFESQWLIVHFGDVMVHIMQPEKRDYYALEELWGDALRVDVHEPTSKTKSPARKRRRS